MAQQPHVDLAGTNFPSPSQSTELIHRSVPIQSYQSFFLIHIGVDPNSRGRWGRRRCHVSPRCRLGHPSVRVGGRHTLAAPACVCSPPSLTPRTSSPLPQAAVPCTCPRPSIRPPSIAGCRGPSGWGSRSVEARYPRRKERSFLDLNLCGRLGVWIKAWFFVRAWFRWYGAGRVVEGGLVS